VITTEQNPIQKLTSRSANQDISLLLYNQNVHYHSNSYLQYQLKEQEISFRNTIVFYSEYVCNLSVRTLKLLLHKLFVVLLFPSITFTVHHPQFHDAKAINSFPSKEKLLKRLLEYLWRTRNILRHVTFTCQSKFFPPTEITINSRS
jgi:hypothetical protein